MSDTNNNGTIDLGSAPPGDFDPFADADELADDDTDDTAAEADAEVAEEAEPEAQPAAEADAPAPEPKKQKKAAAPTDADASEPGDPMTGAIDAADAKETEKTMQSIYEKPPVFEYAGAMENIEDPSQTFDELRIAKAADFPELEDGKRVSWNVEYGKVTKAVADAKGTSIAKMKSDIETSKEFIDALKKSKDKKPDCKIKPRVTAQSKGTAPYKGVYANIDEAIGSGKLITMFPAADGNVYEMRNTDMGRFITRAANNDLLREAEAGFVPALPPVPLKHLLDILAFFKMMAQDGSKEALANIYWDKENETFIVDIPQQSVSMFTVKGEPNPTYANDRYIHYIDIHSHHIMTAFFSATDDADEKATRVYAVAGDVLSYFPEIRVRISNGGKYHEIDPGLVFEDFAKASSLAKLWFGQFQHRVGVLAGMVSSVFETRRNRCDGKQGGDGE